MSPLNQLLRSAWESDMRAIGPALADHVDNCAPTQLHNTHRGMINMGILRNGTCRIDSIAKTIIDIDRPRRVQSSIRDFLHNRSIKHNPTQVLARRWARWFLLGLLTCEPLKPWKMSRAFLLKSLCAFSTLCF